MKYLLVLIRNKYLLAIVIFVVWIGFLDKNNLVKTMKIRHELSNLRADKEYYLKEIEENKRISEELLNNKVSLEKFAREEYFMKKENEEIYIIEFED